MDTKRILRISVTTQKKLCIHFKKIKTSTTMFTINRKHIKALLTVLIALATTCFQAQNFWAGYVAKPITKPGYENLKFRYHAFVRTEGEDDDAAAGLWVRVDRGGGKTGFFDNMQKEPIQSTEWKEYTIEGSVDDDYTRIVFGIWSRYNGKFYIDDVTFEVQTKDNKWETIYKTGYC